MLFQKKIFRDTSLLTSQCEDPGRFVVNGYIENGSTTTSFDMQVRNNTSRYNLIQDAVRMLIKSGRLEKEKGEEIIEKYDTKLKEHSEYIKVHGVDPEEIEDWQWKK
jgi:xylulose-5-phosphate/fructose-6-phosphate phosphoketolase